MNEKKLNEAIRQLEAADYERALGEYILDTAGAPMYSDREDFMVDDVAGGNIDDAYAAGRRDGEIAFARAVRDWVNEEPQ